MALKYILIFAVVVACWTLGYSAPISNSSTKAPAEDPIEDLDYFQYYLDRTYSLMKSEKESDGNSLCFQMKFLSKDKDLMETLGGELTEEQDKREDDDYYAKLLSKLPKRLRNYIRCSSSFANLLFNYRLPAKWSSGSDLNTADVMMLVMKARFLANYPKSCHDYNAFSESPTVNKMDSTLQSVEQTKNDDYMITMKNCYFIGAVNDF